MTNQILTNISKPLYELILEEKKRLQKIQEQKRGVRKKRITMVMASQSLVRKLK